MIKLRSNYDFGLFFIALSATIFKLYLISGQTFSPNYYNFHDQRLFAFEATKILKGQWLGTYDQLTLSKPPFYALWIAFVHILHQPLMLANHLLYILACALFVIAVKPTLNSKAGLTFIYIFLLFNPFSYNSNYMLGFFSESIYPSLTIMVISLAIGLCIRSIRKEKVNILWATCLGITLAAFWLTRAENVWILPFFIFLLLALLIIKKINTKTMLGMVIIPLILCSFLSGAVAFTNWVNYGIFTTCDYNSQGFSTAYGALLRVKQKDFDPHEPLPRETRLKITEFSPSLKKIEPYLENIEERSDYTDRPGEIKGGPMIPVIKMAMTSAGYYHSFKQAEGFYKNLSDEINNACASGKLECDEKRESIFPPWQSNFTNNFLHYWGEDVLYVCQFNDLYPWPYKRVPDQDSLNLFQNLTGPKFIFSHRSGLALSEISNKDIEKIATLENIGDFWQMVITPLMILSGLAFIYMIWSYARTKENAIDLIIAISILTAIITRIAFVALLDTLQSPTSRYMSCVDPLLLMFISFVLVKVGTMVSSVSKTYPPPV